MDYFETFTQIYNYTFQDEYKADVEFRSYGAK